MAPPFHLFRSFLLVLVLAILCHLVKGATLDPLFVYGDFALQSVGLDVDDDVGCSP